jgi:hypothetical protein
MSSITLNTYLVYIHHIGINTYRYLVFTRDMAEFTVTTTAYGVEEKITARAGPRASHVYLPADWEGKKVMVLLLEPLSPSD